MSRAQLLALGFTSKAIKHRVERGRLHPVRRGVYAVGRPELSQRARWLAAVLACGPGAVLSDESAGALWRICPLPARSRIEVTVPAGAFREPPGVRLHRRKLAAERITRHDAIPVTSVVQTLVHLALRRDPRRLETAVNEADKLDLIDPDALRMSLERFAGDGGVAALRAVLDARTFALTDSELERRFLRLARRAGLSKPLTQAEVAGHRADFYWPSLGLVVETDGLRYHRTAGQQARDRQRDQAYALAGLTPLRFTHAQVAREPERVAKTLHTIAGRLDRCLQS